MRTVRRCCPACGVTLVSARHYVCGACWRALPAETRAALNRRDALTVRRAADLFEQIRQAVPLNEITVQP